MERSHSFAFTDRERCGGRFCCCYFNQSRYLRFFTKKEADYGSIRLRFVNLDLSKNPVLQLVQGEKLIESVPLTQPDFQRKLFRPGTYDVRILYDANKNGKWDPGKFFGEKRQPETVYLVSKQIGHRANWDNDVTITL
jgi:hypothetical protein